jgi:hypothetical protein
VKQLDVGGKVEVFCGVAKSEPVISAIESFCIRAISTAVPPGFFALSTGPFISSCALVTGKYLKFGSILDSNWDR